MDGGNSIDSMAATVSGATVAAPVVEVTEMEVTMMTMPVVEAIKVAGA